MKIVNLKFKNINSLAGEWEIDFTEPRFADNGLFAITGKTGSGKSSILDAISLALYGKTPRVEITGQSNDVMTHGTTDCYSEIVFETGGKIWKSAWKQEKTRTGNLKPVNRQISDDTDEIHADQVRSCDNKIVEILGLTFDQFTKVILLAQGSFAAFLQAEKNDKGQLLEQITGTEIYGEISKKVFDRNKTEKEKLEKICIQLGEIKILSEEEIQRLQTKITDFENQKELIFNDLQIIEKAKKWLLDLENLQKQIEESRKKFPELEQNVETAKTAFEKSETALKAAKTGKDETDKILVKVRELDTKIAEKDNLLKPVSQAIDELEKRKNDLSQKIENQINDLQKAQNTLQKTQDWATKNAKYESLIGRFVAIENQNSQVINLLNDFNAKKTESEKTKKDLSAKISIFNNSLTLFAEKEKALKEKTQELETKKAELANILAGKELSDYQSEKEKITQLGSNLKNWIAAEKEIAENQKEIEKQIEIITRSEQTEKELSKTIAESKTTAENIEKQIVLLDENIKLSKTIQSLDEHRRSLEDGKACPLCGSTEHPFARGNEPKIGEKETELKNLKDKIQKLNNSIQHKQQEQTKLVSDKTNALINKEKENKKLWGNNEKQNAILAEIKNLNPDFSIPDDENNIHLLEEIHKQKQNEYQQITSLISKATESEKRIKKLQNEEIPQLQQAKQVTEKEKAEAETAQKLAEQQVKNQENSATQANAQYETANKELLKIFEAYEVSTIENLKKCLENWNENKKKSEDLNAEIARLNTEFALKNSELASNTKLLDEKQTEKKKVETERQTLANQRTELFGDQKADEEETRLKKMIANAEDAKTAAEQAKNNTNTELAKNQAIILEKEKELAVRQAEKMTEKSPEEIETEHDEKKKQSDELLQEIGANRQVLTANDENLAKNSKKLEEKKIQQQICNKWESLNLLIGSQDGKKYRNFAQALTFEHLIGLANRQLQKMSERYILKRIGDATNPFELAVIDKFQNCSERTAQNLSGGEKFIVSLSLALGLANMASRNMCIDTMFIDEGFGTLDSDYLDVALSALSNLQNEGKLIGVISHLSELKERIVTHIEVTSKGNGHSQIEIRY